MNKIMVGIRNNVAMAVITIVALASYIVFGVSLFNQWSIALYVSGLVMLVAFFATFVEPLLKRQRVKIFDWVIMGMSFVVFIGLLAAYIASIPQDTLRGVMLTLSASSVGGVLTLTGVGLSIKYTRIYKEEERLEELKPHVFIIGNSRWNTLPKDRKVSTSVSLSEDSFENSACVNYNIEYTIDFIRIANSDLSICVLRGLLFDDEFLRFKYEIPLTKESYTTILFDPFVYGTNKELNELSLLCEDIMQNQYIVKLGFELKENGIQRLVSIKSAFNAELVKL